MSAIIVPFVALGVALAAPIGVIALGPRPAAKVKRKRPAKLMPSHSRPG